MIESLSSNNELPPPKYEGGIARAWEVYAASTEDESINEKYPDVVGVWLIEAPTIVPRRSSFLGLFVNRVPLKEQKPLLGDSTHIFSLYGFDADNDDHVSVHDMSTIHKHHLFAANKFCAAYDTTAVEIARAAVKMCVEGILAPDPDSHREWSGFFAEH